MQGSNFGSFLLLQMPANISLAVFAGCIGHLHLDLIKLHDLSLHLPVQSLATLLQSRVSETMQVDVHPGAQIGRGVLIDHATGVVIGETAVVGDNVSMLHHVTLGGSGTGTGTRHPHVGEAALHQSSQLPRLSSLRGTAQPICCEISAACVQSAASCQAFSLSKSLALLAIHPG